MVATNLAKFGPNFPAVAIFCWDLNLRLDKQNRFEPNSKKKPANQVFTYLTTIFSTCACPQSEVKPDWFTDFSLRSLDLISTLSRTYQVCLGIHHFCAILQETNFCVELTSFYQAKSVSTRLKRVNCRQHVSSHNDAIFGVSLTECKIISLCIYSPAVIASDTFSTINTDEAQERAIAHSRSTWRHVCEAKPCDNQASHRYGELLHKTVHKRAQYRWNVR